MKLTCSCGATGEFRDNISGAIDANKWNASHEVCRQDSSLRAEVAALRRDAERYRWLRPRFRVFSPHIDGQHGWCATGDVGRLRGPNLDAAIDAAILGAADEKPAQ